MKRRKKETNVPTFTINEENGDSTEYKVQDMSAENQEKLAEMQVAASFMTKNQEFVQQMELANLSNDQQMRLSFLTAKNQAESENMTAGQQTELANLSKRLEVNKVNASLAQQMGLAQLNVDQQRAMQNAATVANIDLTNLRCYLIDHHI